MTYIYIYTLMYWEIWLEKEISPVIAYSFFEGEGVIYDFINVLKLKFVTYSK
jgi:hypothetical protein